MGAKCLTLKIYSSCNVCFCFVQLSSCCNKIIVLCFSPSSLILTMGQHYNPSSYKWNHINCVCLRSQFKFTVNGQIIVQEKQIW